jgi:hypothetical protein
MSQLHVVGENFEFSPQSATAAKLTLPP